MRLGVVAVPLSCLGRRKTEVGEFVDLGDLKGNKQYEIPEGVDVSRFDTVVIWCRAFSVGFGAATLVAS